MSVTQRQPVTEPAWWKDEHSSSWDRAKEALRRDWEQTKADLSDGGQELNQTAGDTLRQASGKEPIPPAGFANPNHSAHDRSWSNAEPALRYGHGARQYYSERDWNDDLEQELRADWNRSGNESSWEKVKVHVRRGWDSVKRAV